MNRNKGNLYLIPSTLGDTSPFEVLPLSVKKAIEAINYYIVENEKTARRFIKILVPRKSQDELKIERINKYTDPDEIPQMIAPCIEGHHIGVISEAGCPGVADPGAQLVLEAHKKNIRVIPLVGPSSILLAMMGSGLNGQNFAFNGYLPIEKQERKRELKRLERLSGEFNQSQLFIETPYRNNQLLESILATLRENTKLCIACDITLSTEFIKTQTITAWKKTKVDLHKRPTMFVIHQ